MKSRERVWIIMGVLMQMKPIHDGMIYIPAFRTLMESSKSLNTHESTKAFKTVPLSVHHASHTGLVIVEDRIKLFCLLRDNINRHIIVTL